MSLSTKTAFFRNFFCVAKTFLPPTSLLSVKPFKAAPFPFNEVSTLEFMIAITQFMAVVFNIVSSYDNLILGVREYLRARKASLVVDRITVQGESWGVEQTILRHNLKENLQNGIRQALVGCADFLVGCAFIFLMANSLHLRAASHPVPVYQALITVEIALSYYLVVMGRGVLSKLKDGLKFQELRKLLLHSANSPVTHRNLLDLSCEAGFLDNLMQFYNFVNPNFTPSYRRKPAMVDGIKEDLGEIAKFFSEEVVTEPATETSVAKVSKVPRSSVVDSAFLENLHVASRRSFAEATVGFVVLALNALAGYGYLMAIFAFFFPNAYATASTPSKDTIAHSLARSVMLNLPHSSADWWGNLLGDMAWTIEPLVCLVKPALISLLVYKVCYCNCLEHASIHHVERSLIKLVHVCLTSHRNCKTTTRRNKSKSSVAPLSVSLCTLALFNSLFA
jgi:hypothetical protein